MNKTTWIPLCLSLATMILLYLIGFIFNLSFLEFKFNVSKSSYELEIALLPIAIGLLIGFIVERTMKKKKNKK